MQAILSEKSLNLYVPGKHYGSVLLNLTITRQMTTLKPSEPFHCQIPWNISQQLILPSQGISNKSWRPTNKSWTPPKCEATHHEVKATEPTITRNFKTPSHWTNKTQSLGQKFHCIGYQTSGIHGLGGLGSFVLFCQSWWQGLIVVWGLIIGHTCKQ